MEERLGHLEPPSGGLSPDDLKHHLPAVDANGLEPPFQSLTDEIAAGLLRPGREKQNVLK